MRIPVITINDWVSLQFVEAETRTEALLKAATAWIEQCGGEVRLDPDGVSGEGTPNAQLIVQQPKMVLNPELGERLWSPELGVDFLVQDGWETESTWIVPIADL